MAAGQGFKTFTTGEVLTAGDVNGYLMQGINVFATTTARDAAITAPAEGQFAFTKDTNSLWYYDGAAWVASGAAGDIEGVTAGVGISGGGTSGTVTVTNSMATAIDAKGDLVPGTGADTFARLAIGANGTVLTADSVEATGMKWATASSGGMTAIATGTLTGSSISLASIPATYNSLLLTLNSFSLSGNGKIKVLLNNDTSTSYFYSTFYGGTSTGVASSNTAAQWLINWEVTASGQDNQAAAIYFPNYVSTGGSIATSWCNYRNATGASWSFDQTNCYNIGQSTINRIEFFANYTGAFTFDAGTYTLWGIK